MRKASSATASSQQELPPSGSLENIYEKIKDLKSEFQHVEEKMRSAVEALNYPDKVGGVARDDSGHYSSGSSGSGYYPGKIAERMMKQQEQESSSGVSTPTYPFSVSSCSSPPPAASQPQQPRPQLRHCDTYVQIPVERGHERSRRPVWSKEVASWKLTWERSGKKKEVIEYRATVIEYE